MTDEKYSGIVASRMNKRSDEDLPRKARETLRNAVQAMKELTEYTRENTLVLPQGAEDPIWNYSQTLERLIERLWTLDDQGYVYYEREGSEGPVNKGHEPYSQ